MKYDVTFTEQAENDLRGIFEYIAFDLLSPENAAGQLDRIEEKILSLGEYPEKFRQYEREPWKSRNTRVVPVDNYVIFYIPDRSNDKNDKDCLKLDFFSKCHFLIVNAVVNHPFC